MASVLVARTGRHRQRYEDDFRLVAGCIPYRRKANSECHSASIIDRLEVLMISSPNRDDLVFPKGGWENDETMQQAACREALEEAGVKGIIDESCLGFWIFRSKSRQNSCSSEGTCKGHMFALEVTEELQYWPEQASHKRRWVQVREAYQLCRYEWMREALTCFIQVMSVQTMRPASELPEPTNFIQLMSVQTMRPAPELPESKNFIQVMSVQTMRPAPELPEPKKSNFFMMKPSTAEPALA